MYVTTFYSFKGGVGRTMALVNVAYELARSGKRVLLVDFDLEAPGLDTFNESRASFATPGVVDFVLDYLGGDSPPDVANYVYEVPDLQGEAEPLLIMPAGRTDDGYASRLSRIDWVNLYTQHDGYLLFEDLRAQWSKRLNIDYVLVDSRTGHTDVGGICTRQLPDGVVVLFFPNEQNLRGLRKVVSDIREEPHASGRDPIDLIFVASDVPDLDDEEDIFRRRLSVFRRQLAMRDRPEVIYHYDSLALLEQPIFTRDRPQTSLAKQYRALARKIQEANVEDREGVLAFLREPLRRMRSSAEVGRLFDRLSDIESAHPTDGEILYRLAEVRSNLGQISAAVTLLEDALEIGYSKPIVFLQLAEAHQRLGNADEASKGALQVFADSSASLDLLWRTIELLRLVRPEAITDAVHSPALKSLPISDRVALASTFNRSQQEYLAAKHVLEPILHRAKGSEEWFVPAQFAFGLALMGLGEVDRARQIFSDQVRRDPEAIAPIFNLAMAEWGVSGLPKPELFRATAERISSGPQTMVANYAQCFAITSSIIGDKASARAYLRRARQLIAQQSTPEFSCWRYMRVSPNEFQDDLRSIERFIDGEPEQPPFIRQAPGALDVHGGSVT